MLSGPVHTVNPSLPPLLAISRLTHGAGAPETFRSDDTTVSFPLQVKSDVDIWSMGCVFSEAAVWSRFGWKRVLEYRRRRQDEVKDNLGLGGEQLFHDGKEVLGIVKYTHDHIGKGARDIDHVTVEILRFLNDDMLLNERQPRSSAKRIYEMSKQVIKATREKFKVPATEFSSAKDEECGHADDSDEDETPMTPPVVPPGYIGSSARSARKAAVTGLSNFVSTRPVSINSMISHSSGLRSATTTRQYHSVVRHEDAQDGLDESPLFGPFRSESFGLHDLPDPSPSPVSSHPESPIDRFKALSINTEDLEHSQGRRRPHAETMGATTNRAMFSAADRASVQRSQSEKTPSEHPHRYSVRSASGSFSDSPSPIHEAKLPTPPPSSSSNHHRSESSPNVEGVRSGSKNRPQQADLERSHLSLSEGLLWKERKKEGHHTPLKGQENLSYLNQRDHVSLQIARLVERNRKG